MLTIPENYHFIKTTGFYNCHNTPEILLKKHQILIGEFGRISVMKGCVNYRGFLRQDVELKEIDYTINEMEFFIVSSKYWHLLEIMSEETCFSIDFFSKLTSPKDAFQTDE